MIQERSLETHLERLLRFGTITFSAIIAMGVLADAVNAFSAPIDLVTFGIVGFILLPVVRLSRMLAHYISAKDIPMKWVVGIVHMLVIAGVVLGIVW